MNKKQVCGRLNNNKSDEVIILSSIKPSTKPSIKPSIDNGMQCKNKNIFLTMLLILIIVLIVTVIYQMCSKNSIMSSTNLYGKVNYNSYGEFKF